MTHKKSHDFNVAPFVADQRRGHRHGFAVTFVFAVAAIVGAAQADETPSFDRDVAPLLKRHCVKCHGPTKQEGKLNLAKPGSMARGGQGGVPVVPHDAASSLLWQRVNADEMPPDKPLNADEKSLLERWIVAGAPGLATDRPSAESDHWSFRPFSKLPRAEVDGQKLAACRTFVDAWIARGLSVDGLNLSPDADRPSQIRRVSFDLTGLPPTAAAIDEFVSDDRPDAYERMVDRYLASPHYGERFGKLWLDAAGYADSNGYFNADSDRPLAYRYRDYVIRSLNSDKRFDQFIREQIAGDEIAQLKTKNGESVQYSDLSPSRVIELLEATHYLRCGQDGSGESDGNPDEVRVDRYTVIETSMQNLSTGLLGLTIQCAKCHDHKFEPLTQRDFYSFQAVLIPAFPPENWVKPNDRFVYATIPGEFEDWQAKVAQAEKDIAQLGKEIGEWVRQNRPQGWILFSDDFEGPAESLAEKWSDTAPGDDAPGGTAAVKLNSREAPAAIISGGRLELIEGGPGGDKWLSTKTAIDWAPDIVGASIQVTFDLIDHHVGSSAPAERIGYFIALNDFNDNGAVAGGNILIDGNPSAGAAVFVDYPGSDQKHEGVIGTTGYAPGRNYGVRITNKGKGKYLLQHLVDWQVEDKTITLSEEMLPNGGFGFEFCCNRSFVVDNVVIESFSPQNGTDPLADFLKQLKSKRQPLEETLKRKNALGGSRPGKIAWTSDLVETPPDVHVFLRGNYNTPGELVGASGYSFLNKPASAIESLNGDGGNDSRDDSLVPDHAIRGSGRRLTFANWLTERGSPQCALMARVQVNRLWQHLFGAGIVATPDNLGLSGSPPMHPELLECLAGEFAERGWSTKRIARFIVESSVYRQSGTADEARLRADADGRRLSRYPIRRLDAEAIRDMLLAASGDLDDRLYGPYVATSRTGAGETVVAEDNPGSRRRSIYLQQKRTQVHSLLQLFDAPSIVFNSTRRPRSTMPIQSLSLMNSDFSIARAKSLANDLMNHFRSDSDRIARLFVVTTGRPAGEDEIASATRFLDTQTRAYLTESDPSARAWADLCQLLLIGNSALYLE